METDTEEDHSEDEGGDQSDASTSQGVPKIASKLPDLGRSIQRIFPHSPQREPTLPQKLGPGLLVSELQDNTVLVFQSPSLWCFFMTAVEN